MRILSVLLSFSLSAFVGCKDRSTTHPTPKVEATKSIFKDSIDKAKGASGGITGHDVSVAEQDKTLIEE